MQILGLLGMYFDAVVVEVEKYVFTFFQIGSGHTVLRWKNWQPKKVTVIPIVIYKQCIIREKFDVGLGGKLSKRTVLLMILFYFCISKPSSKISENNCQLRKGGQISKRILICWIVVKVPKKIIHVYCKMGTKSRLFLRF